MRYLGLIIFLLSWNLFADIIYLKDGNVIEGKIINQTRTNIQIQLEDQKIITLNKERIERILFGPTQNEIEEQKRQEELKRKQQEEQKRLEQQKREEEIKRKQEEIKQQEALRKKLEEPTVQYNHFFDISLLVGPNIQKPIIGRYLRSLLATGSKGSFFDNKPNETSIHVAKDKLKDSYTLNTRLSYTNPYLNLGIDFFSIDTTYYFFNSTYVNFNNTLNLYRYPTEDHFKPYKQLQYRVFAEMHLSKIYLNQFTNTNDKIYLHISSLDQYYEANLNQKISVFANPSPPFATNNTIAILNHDSKISIAEKGVMIGPAFQWNLNPYMISARYTIIRGNAYLKYTNNQASLAFVFFPVLSVDQIERDANLKGFEFALSIKKVILKNLFLVGSLRSLEMDYNFTNFNSKSFDNFVFSYDDKESAPFFSALDEKKLHYSMLDILFGIEYRLNLL
jgi:hypothetical protein